MSIFVLLNADVMTAQSLSRDLDREVLVYILADSLEIPYGIQGRTTVDKIQIRSNSLAETLRDFSIEEIARSFPDWAKEDSVRIREDGRIIQRPRFDRVFTVYLTKNQSIEQVIERLESHPSVLYAESQMGARLSNDPQYSLQWYLNNTGQVGVTTGGDIGAEQAWQIFTGSSNIKIGIFDTGVDLAHDEFTGRISGDGIYQIHGEEPNLSHGTHIAGIAAAKGNNGIGGRGVDWNAQIVSRRIFDGFGNYLGHTNTAHKIIVAVDYDSVHVLNHSWDGSNSATVRQAFAYAYMMNRVSTAAMGNGAIADNNAKKYPAAYGQGIISVGGTLYNDHRNNNSQTGVHIKVVAPGGNDTSTRGIYSTIRNNEYGFRSGTSQATAVVSGIASLLKGYNPNLYNDDIQQLIQLSADKVHPITYSYNSNGWSNEMGYGRVNAYEALKRLQTPYILHHYSANGGYVYHISNTYSLRFYNVQGLADAIYQVKRYEVRRSVNYPWIDEPAVWGRGAASNGFSDVNPNYGIMFNDAVSISNSSATLRTFVYEVWASNGDYLGYYPTSPANVSFAYTVHGLPGNAPPNPPTISINTSGINPALSWNNVSGATLYKLFRGTIQGAPNVVNCNLINNYWHFHTTSTTSYYDGSVMIDPNEHTLTCYYIKAVNNYGDSQPSNKVGTHGIAPFKSPPDTQHPEQFALSQNYPNPFNPTTTIAYDIPQQSVVNLEVFDIMGRKVAILESSTKAPGSYFTTFDASHLSSGLYITRFKAISSTGEVFGRDFKMQLVK